MSKTCDRIDVIDAVRGFAVLGIVLANIQSWSGYKFLPFDVLETLPGAGLDGLFYWMHVALVDGKFYAIFSILFGIGFRLQWERKGHEPDIFLPVYRRRIVFLLLFGVLHALFWSGDILTLYALLAFVMVELRGQSARAQLRLALGLLCFLVHTNGVYMLLAGAPEAVETASRASYPDMSGAAVVAAYASDSVARVFETNLHNLYWRWVEFLPNGRVSRVLGFFLLGGYLMRTGFFTGTARKPSMILVFGIPGFALTLLAMQLGLGMASWPSSWIDIAAKLANVAGQVLMALSYMCILTCAYGSPVGRTLMHPLTLVGRTAFTSYLSQSRLGVAIFYGIGLGHIGTLGLAPLWGVAIGIYAFQVLAASTWLRVFKQGPIEWIWRCLTQKRYIPNLRTP